MSDHFDEPVFDTSKENDEVKKMVTWFLDNYEDPTENTPWDGGFVWIYGGPYRADEELGDKFPEALQEDLERAAEILSKEVGEWTKPPGPDFGEPSGETIEDSEIEK